MSNSFEMAIEIVEEGEAPAKATESKVYLAIDESSD